LGTDAAQAIIRGLAPVLDHGLRQNVDAAERGLVAAACGTGEDTSVPCPAEGVRLQALVWQCVLDPDGADQSEQRALRKRFLRIGREQDGLVRLSGALLPEVAGKLLRLLDCGLAPKTAPVFASAEEQAAHAAREAAQTADADGAESASSETAGRVVSEADAGRVVSEAEAGLLDCGDTRTREQQAHDVFVPDRHHRQKG
jgi:hypothetical protein